MKTFIEAQTIVFSSATLMETEHVELSEALGRILAGTVIADADMPPFSRSAMDGYACHAGDQDMPLEIIDEIPAGKFPEKKIRKGQCAKIMTGAPVPDGSDMVIRVEDMEINDDGRVVIHVKGKVSNIRLQGEDFRKDEKVILPGQRINKQHIGIMAMAGHTKPVVYKQPSVGIITTGAELVPADRTPERSQIRNSNGPQLMAQVMDLGLKGKDYGNVTDDPERIREVILRAVNQHSVVLISGGVSAGDYDFVPDILRETGMDIRLHKMKVRPGKPLLFAVNHNSFVFGIPGNPVSTFVQFECLIKPFLLKLMGNTIFEKRYPMYMGEDYRHVESELQFFIPVRFTERGVFTLSYHGSGHLTSYVNADGILEIPPGKTFIKKGELVHVRPV
ncbi:MAG: molybdopterin molybdotransferase MoeA [Cyclobacteriaceae bacterium]|nr:molybdopterin molybdotransferase MoeA [Cyclobacteriaceae bacterium]